MTLKMKTCKYEKTFGTFGLSDCASKEKNCSLKSFSVKQLFVKAIAGELKQVVLKKYECERQDTSILSTFF